MQQQKGGIDCGLFGIATACELLLFGNNPSEIQYDQEQMRGHCVTCFRNGKLTPFPRKSGRNVIRNPTIVGRIELVCICRLPKCHGDIVHCRNKKCKKEYHKQCVEWDSLPSATRKYWICNDCK